MKKKRLFSLLIVVTLFTLTGCINLNPLKSKNNKFKVGNEVLKFDQKKTFNNFTYYSIEEIEPDESKQALYLMYKNKDIYDGRFVFRIGMAYSSETNIKEFLESRETEDVTINGINWKKLTMNATSDNKNTTSLNYATEIDGTVYVVSVLAFDEANVELSNLADIFINGVTIEVNNK